jgi:hypothetical protein
LAKKRDISVELKSQNNFEDPYYRKKNSPQRHKSPDNEVTEMVTAAKNHQAQASNKNQSNMGKTTFSDTIKQSLLATAASTQTTESGKGVVRKILGSVVIGEGTTTMITDMGISIPVITQATTTNQLVDTSMESGSFSVEESFQTKLMSYEADHSADELDTMDGENDFMNLSATATTTKAPEFVTHLNHSLTMGNDTITNLSEQLIDMSMIQQELEVRINEPPPLKITTISESNISSVVNTISPDKNKEPNLQATPAITKQPDHIEQNINNNGFTVVQRTRKAHQQSALEHLKKQYKISKHGLPTPSVSFQNSYIAYYDLRVPLLETKADASPWDEVLWAFKAMMTELWGADPMIKIFIYDTKTRSNDTSF